MKSSSNFPIEIETKLQKSRVVAVLVIDNVSDAFPLAKTLLDGGIDIMELTLRTPAALEALKEIKAHVPEMVAGIGTILTPEQVVQAGTAGAAFGVAPGFNPRVVSEAQKVGLPFAPGICTASEIEGAVEMGCRILKFFPSETSGGVKMLSTLSAPFAHLGLKYIPLGGLNAENFSVYLKNPSVIAVGGSWIAKREDIQNNRWDQIKANALFTRQTIDSCVN
jgi:2-dehydro-3-deoxyphosphogluconate aldolase/(4S)-4-hydroxy-2-oxoglutarate aldolase